MAIRYYDGWRPDQAEIADLVAVELSVLHIDEAIDRQHRRLAGQPVADILPIVHARFADRQSQHLARERSKAAAS